MLNVDGLKGIFLFHELIFPIIPLDCVIQLGEGHTPLVRANAELSRWVGVDFSIKYDGLNPSASFKDRGMASAISFINYMIKSKGIKELLGICASTGDTSAAAALYLSYLPHDVVRSVVLLPQGKVTPAQLSQPLGSGATVIEVPGVFDDCMRIVEQLAEEYEVCLLNSKNPIRIQGQKSYSYEVAQQLDFQTQDLVVVVPIGNAGNVTAVMEGFLDLNRLGIIEELPMIIGVQSDACEPRGALARARGVPAGGGPPQRGPGCHDREPGLLPQGLAARRGALSRAVFCPSRSRSRRSSRGCSSPTATATWSAPRGGSPS